jgi:antitoxin ParD1/3/4
MARTSRPLTVTLGDLEGRVKARVKSGAYASASEVIRAGLRALDREERALDEWLRRMVDEAFADPRPDIPAREVFKAIRRYHDEQTKPRAG